MKKGVVMDIIKNLTNAITLLDEIESELNNSPAMQSNIDSKLSDIYHYIESNKLNTSQRYRIVGILADLRKERREILNDYELLKTFKNNEAKLCQKDNRKMLLAEIRKKEKQLQTVYKNRIYTEEELKELVGD
jgi:cell fate (sporulation/competence/biofilm development) regulator YlbF (YheA/YmcA/DUF963 family)